MPCPEALVYQFGSHTKSTKLFNNHKGFLAGPQHILVNLPGRREKPEQKKCLISGFHTSHTIKFTKYGQIPLKKNLTYYQTFFS